MGGGTVALFGLVFPLCKYYYQKQDESDAQSMTKHLIRYTSPDHLKIADIIDFDHIVAVEAINFKIVWFSPL